MNVLQRQLSGVRRAALLAVVCMPPRADQARPSCVEVHGEAFGLGIQLNLPVGTPLGNDRTTCDLDSLQDAAEFQVRRGSKIHVL